jgi:hypothetical protein
MRITSEILDHDAVAGGIGRAQREANFDDDVSITA